MVNDAAPEKWKYREHTRVKHILLEKYLAAWMPILGKWNPKICYFDGFAGRGKYTDGPLGSPVIALKVADKLARYYGKMLFVFIEKDNKNFENLQQVLEREKPAITNLHKMEIILENNEFANVVREIFEHLEEKKGILVPSFFFIDPFGFSGVPFEVITKILSNPKTEVFFTFMIRDIARFIEHPQLKEAFTDLFGTDEWKTVIRLPDREKALIELYRKQLHEAAGTKYSLHFRVSESDKLKTLYYLIHATNNFKGHSIMKQVMFNQSVDGSFAFLGPKDLTGRCQTKLFDIHDIAQLKGLLPKRFKGETLTYEEIQEKICFPWYSEPPYVDKHYREALKELEKESRIKVERVTSKEKGLRGKDRITFLKNNPVQIKLTTLEQDFVTEVPPKINLYYKEYELLNGTRKLMIWKVNDGSIITRFDKTPPPVGKNDVVCPHFIELKWAYGCPFDCAWCYLKGTFRFRPEGTSPTVKPYSKIKQHVTRFLEEIEEPEVLNTGEIADSLMYENVEFPFSKFIIPLFEQQRLHKVLFLTKSSNVRNLLELEAHNQAIISFSLNALPVSERWERAPHVLRRIEAAKKLFDAGYEVRIRIDPIVPIQNWGKHYLELLNIIFNNFTPGRITLGSLRGLQSTINGCTDKTWVSYLKETSNWGKKVEFETRRLTYLTIIRELQTTYKFNKVALCKETVQMWDALGLDYREIMCNCTW